MSLFLFVHNFKEHSSQIDNANLGKTKKVQKNYQSTYFTEYQLHSLDVQCIHLFSVKAIKTPLNTREVKSKENYREIPNLLNSDICLYKKSSASQQN